MLRIEYDLLCSCSILFGVGLNCGYIIFKQNPAYYLFTKLKAYKLSNYNLSIPLTKREDKNGKTFYIAKIKTPVQINLEPGATFLVFVSEDGMEEMQIAPFQEKFERADKKETEIVQRR